MADMKTSEENKYFNSKPNEQYTNELAKVYEINTHGKFTVIVRRSFIRLHIRPTTNINPCYSYDVSSMCDSEVLVQSNRTRNYDWKLNRKGKRRTPMHRSMQILITTVKTSSNFIVHESTTHNPVPIIIQHEQSHYGFYAFIFVISVVILGFILWYMFIRPSQTPKSKIRPPSDDSDSDNSNDNNQYKVQTLNDYRGDHRSLRRNKSANSLLFHDDDDNHLERKLSDDMTFNNIRNHHETIQMLINNLQQSDFESINSSTIGEILSELIHNEVDLVNENPNRQSSSDLATFLRDASEIFHIVRNIITEKCSRQLLNPNNFLQYQYLIDIVHSSEFILEYLHQNYSNEQVFVIEILTHLHETLSTMNNNSQRCQYICQCLFDILQKLNRNQTS
ncbi:unnamed protein product [Rotaria magnacalcarata]|uniref:Uncharacterized protein n=1 Tax=Rotaria magnacalcarata TaxID=392030 RepID=A0A816UMW4_9BILA|nr:unnamed protein product [Rotaria magnacalcarata]CAF4099787.1 unnamed protein product [Rotaria magnacalcarata]